MPPAVACPAGCSASGLASCDTAACALGPWQRLGLRLRQPQTAQHLEELNLETCRLVSQARRAIQRQRPQAWQCQRAMPTAAPLGLLLLLLGLLAVTPSAAKQVRGVAAALEAGEQLAAKGRYVDAERAFVTVLKHKPDSAKALLNLGTLLPTLGRHAEGLSALEQLVAIAPRNPSAHFSLGRLQAMGASHAASVDSLRRSSELLLASEPERAAGTSTDLSASVLQGLGASLLHLGRYAEALDVSDTFSAVRQLPARALSNRASALLHLGRAAEALADWDAAIAAESKDLSLLVLRAQGLRRLGRGKEAAENLITALTGMVGSYVHRHSLHTLVFRDLT